MPSKRIRTLCLAGLLVAHAAGCSGLHTRLSDRLRGNASTTDSRREPGVARLDSIDSPGAGPQAQPQTGAPILPAPPASTPQPGGAATTPEGDDRGASNNPPVDPRIAARALLDDLGARITEDESGEVVSIDLAETGVTDKDLAQVAAFSRVRELNFRGTVISDTGLEALGGLTELEFLGLTGTQVSDAGLARLGKLQRLRFLTLGRTSVSDAGLSTIINWNQLEGLNVKATRVTDRGAERLRRQLPRCRVIVDGPGSGVGTTRPGAATSRGTDSRQGSERRESAPAPVLPRPNPEVERHDIDSIESTPNSGAPASRARDRRPFNLEEDWEAAVSTPTTSATTPDPQQRLMIVLREKLEDPEVLKAIAEVQLSQHQPTEALRLLEAAADRAPEDRELRYVLGVTRARCGDFDAAINDLALAVGEAAAHYNLGVLLHEAGNDPRAIREFQRALRCDPNFRAAREWLAELTLPDARASGLADSPLLSEEEIRGLILQWTDRGAPRVEASLRRVDGAPPRLEVVAPVVEPAAPPVKTATRVEPELYPGRSTQAAAEAPAR